MLCDHGWQRCDRLSSPLAVQSVTVLLFKIKGTFWCSSEEIIVDKCVGGFSCPTHLIFPVQYNDLLNIFWNVRSRKRLQTSNRLFLTGYPYNQLHSILTKIVSYNDLVTIFVFFSTTGNSYLSLDPISARKDLWCVQYCLLGYTHCMEEELSPSIESGEIVQQAKRLMLLSDTIFEMLNQSSLLWQLQHFIPMLGKHKKEQKDKH